MLKIGILAIMSVFLGLMFKGRHGEYVLLISMATAILIFSLSLGKMESVIGVMKQLQETVHLDGTYLDILLKMVGITYVAEFASGTCKDAGYSNIAGQVEMAGKLMVLTISVPVLTSLLDTVGLFVSQTTP